MAVHVTSSDRVFYMTCFFLQLPVFENLAHPSKLSVCWVLQPGPPTNLMSPDLFPLLGLFNCTPHEWKSMFPDCLAVPVLSQIFLLITCDWIDNRSITWALGGGHSLHSCCAYTSCPVWQFTIIYETSPRNIGPAQHSWMIPDIFHLPGPEDKLFSFVFHFDIILPVCSHFRAVWGELCISFCGL